MGERLKKGMGNRGLKELICTTHGHELRGGMLEHWGSIAEGGQRGENWEKCNSIINTYIFFKKTVSLASQYS